MSELDTWFCSNKLSLNTSKSKLMLFGTQPQLTMFQDVSVTHRGLALEKCHKFKYLGVMLDSRLTFEEHVTYMKSKTIGKIRLLGRIRHIIDRETAVMLYKTLILPIYDYCDYLYYPLGTTTSDSLQVLQNTALRTIIRAEPRTATDILHAQVQMPRLDLRRKIHVAEYMYKIMNDMCPPECSIQFTCLNLIRTRSTRSEDDDLLVIPSRKLVTMERSLRYFGAVIWNSIPLAIRNLPTRNEFKRVLTDFWTSQ